MVWFALQKWRQDFNATFLRIDLWWTIVTGFLVAVYYQRWPDGGSKALLWLTFCGILPTVVLLTLQVKYTAFYIRHRIIIVCVLRTVRLLGILFGVGPCQNHIWPPRNTMACHSTLLSTQPNKLIFLGAQTFGFRVPLVFQVYFSIAGAAIVLSYVPERCLAQLALSPEVGQCSLNWMTKLSWLNKLWVFSFSNSEEHGASLEPWQLCTMLQAMLIVSDQ